MRSLLIIIFGLTLATGAHGALQTVTYPSSIDNISNLSARVAYPGAGANLPIVIVMPGLTGDALSFGDETLTRIANNGLFVVSVGMRGRSGASGSQDCGGREIYDIYDAVTYVRANYTGVVSADKTAIVGYSGGGGNVLSCATKFPDTFTDFISHFGISDYGHDATYGWWQQTDGTYRPYLESWIGGTPAQVPDSYYARDSLSAVKNILGGHVYLFHDVDDSAVNVNHSQRIASAMTAEGLSNFTANYSTSGSPYRWLHGYPATGSSLAHTEDTWVSAITGNTHPVWTYPASGIIRVLGFIKTKRFEIWLGDGKSEAADVTFNATTGTYTVVPLTGTVVVTVKQGAETRQVTISETTTISFAPSIRHPNGTTAGTIKKHNGQPAGTPKRKRNGNWQSN